MSVMALPMNQYGGGEEWDMALVLLALFLFGKFLGLF